MRASSPPPLSLSGFEPKHASPYSILYEGQDTGTHIPAQKVDPRTLKAVLANHAENEEDIKLVAPDGGCLAWMIVAASFMVSFLQDGFRDSFGLLLPSVSMHFNTGRTEAAMTNSIMTFLTLGSGPLVAFMVQKIGHRNVTVIGVFLASLGLLVAGFSIEYMAPPSLAVLYVSVGLMTGLGFGFMYLPAMDIIEVYFDRNLGLATGIAAAGSGLGQLIMAPVIHILEEKMGLAFTMTFLSGTVALAIVFAFIYRVPKKRKSHSFYEGRSDLTFFHEHVKVVKISPTPEDYTFNSHHSETGERTRGCLSALLTSYTSIFKSPAMIVLLLSHFLMHIAIFAAFAFTADRALVLGLSKHSTAQLLSVMGVSNCIGRIVFGKLLDVFRNKAFTLTGIVLLVNALVVTVSDYLTSFAGQAVFAAVFGATFGAYISSVVVILKLINKDKITDSLGVCLMVFALASLVGPAIVGQIFDAHGSYRVGFLVAGCFGLVGALIFPLVPIICQKKK